MECGVGGEYDATNVVEQPLVTAITSLGFDHMPLLGHTIGEIAWHKAGIMKQNVPAFTSEQPLDAMRVIRDRAGERSIGKSFQSKEGALSAVYEVDSTDEALVREIKLGLAGAHQYKNAALAYRACREWAHAYGRRHPGRSVDADEARSRRGLEAVRWPGRAQTLVVPSHPTVTWLLDGAHTSESLQVCAEWFRDVCAEPTDRPPKNALFFNCTGGRDPRELLRHLATLSAPAKFDRVYFCTNDVLSVSNADSTNFTVRRDASLATQRANASAWAEVTAEDCVVEVCASVDEAVASLEAAAASSGAAAESSSGGDQERPRWRALVTGSLHLVGGFLTFLGAEVV
ncbi:hypothetical protein HK405_013538 [Cladochytrium tenue]|nr:hypothetical protein HK405_013538 [Cladochytrium tenue]